MSKRLRASLIAASPFWGVAACIWVLSHYADPVVVGTFLYKAQWLINIGLVIAWIESLCYDDKYGF